MSTARSEIVDELGCTEDELQSAVETVDAIKRAEQRRRQMIEFPHSTTIDGQRVHLFQDVREELDANPFTDGETVVWTVCAIRTSSTEEVASDVAGEASNEIQEDDEQLLLKKAHANWQSRWVSFEEFVDGAYEPIFLKSEDGKVPKFGY